MQSNVALRNACFLAGVQSRLKCLLRDIESVEFMVWLWARHQLLLAMVWKCIDNCTLISMETSTPTRGRPICLRICYILNIKYLIESAYDWSASTKWFGCIMQTAHLTFSDFDTSELLVAGAVFQWPTLYWIHRNWVIHSKWILYRNCVSAIRKVNKNKCILNRSVSK